MTASEHIHNFRQINEWLYRGGQPDAEGIEALAQMKIKTVITLRYHKRVVETERALVVAQGMNFVSMPLSYWGLPDETEINRFLPILDNPENRPIYVHCLHGCDRTGLLCAIYRIERCGWSLDDAYREMLACGFHRFRIWHYKWALRRYSRRAALRVSTNQQT